MDFSTSPMAGRGCLVTGAGRGLGAALALDRDGGRGHLRADPRPSLRPAVGLRGQPRDHELRRPGDERSRDVHGRLLRAGRRGQRGALRRLWRPASGGEALPGDADGAGAAGDPGAAGAADAELLAAVGPGTRSRVTFSPATRS